MKYGIAVLAISLMAASTVHAGDPKNCPPKHPDQCGGFLPNSENGSNDTSTRLSGESIKGKFLFLETGSGQDGACWPGWHRCMTRTGCCPD